MKKATNRIFFKFCRFCYRLFTPEYHACLSVKTSVPSVYVVHHQNMRGPVLSTAWLNTNIRPWVLNVFCNRRDCFNQYYGYTFTKRFGMPKVLAAAITFPLSFFVSGLMSSMQAIPVYRRSRDIVKTFKQSILTLMSGQSLLICPDIDYKDTSSNVGEMYDGFLDLEKYYMKQTGNHLAFIPLHISKHRKIIYVGQAVYFKTEENFNKEKSKTYDLLKQEFSRLEMQMDK